MLAGRFWFLWKTTSLPIAREKKKPPRKTLMDILDLWRPDRHDDRRVATFYGRLHPVEKTLDTATSTLIEQVKQGEKLRALTQRVKRVKRIVDGRP
jgi:hypothetical protein